MSIVLRAFTDFSAPETTRVGRELYEGVRLSHDRLEADFPRVLLRYGTARAAIETITLRQAEMKQANGLFGAYAVMTDGHTIGVATFSQFRLTDRGRFGWLVPVRFQKEVANGPLMAMWLADSRHRSAEHRGVLPLVLQLAAGLFKQNTVVTGKPFTVVRPDHYYVRDCLAHPQNGFGGFAKVGEAKMWWNIDDGTAHPRLLYVARYTARDMRVLEASAI